MSIASVREVNKRFIIEFSNGRHCEVSFEKRHEAETMAFYIRQAYSDGRAQAKAEIRLVLGIEE